MRHARGSDDGLDGCLVVEGPRSSDWKSVGPEHCRILSHVQELGELVDQTS